MLKRMLMRSSSNFSDIHPVKNQTPEASADPRADRTFNGAQRKIFDLTLALYRVTDFFPKDEVLRKSLREKANEIFSGATEYVYGGDSHIGDAIAILGKIEAIKGYLELARSLKLVRPINITVLEREYASLADFFDPVRDLVSAETPSENNSAIKRAPTGVNSFRISNVAGKQSDTNRREEAMTRPEALSTWDEFVPRDGISATETDVKDKKIKKAEKIIAGSFVGISEVISNRQKQILEHLKLSSQAKISDFYTAFSNISSKTIQRDLQDLVGRNILKKDGEKRWTVYSLNSVQ
ncbi:MAG: hypothetical protein HYT98_01470 [Candidatus Sungbacteria bacterium]|nr:hypothetical protein [Candidatus Sungbacteria bacterium]